MKVNIPALLAVGRSLSRFHLHLGGVAFQPPARPVTGRRPLRLVESRHDSAHAHRDLETFVGRAALLRRPNIRAERQLRPTRFMESFHDSVNAHWDHEPGSERSAGGSPARFAAPSKHAGEPPALRRFMRRGNLQSSDAT